MGKGYRGYIRGLSALFAICKCNNPNTQAPAIHMINRTFTLFNYAWGEDGEAWSKTHGPRPSYQEYDEASNINQQEKYIDQGSCFIDEETEALNKKGRDDLNDLHKNNQKFRDEFIYFIGDETDLSNEKMLDKRYKHNTLKKLGIETLATFPFSKDHARS